MGESQSVLSNVKQKLIEAFEGLAQFLVDDALFRAKKEKIRASRLLKRKESQRT